MSVASNGGPPGPPTTSTLPGNGTPGGAHNRPQGHDLNVWEEFQRRDEFPMINEAWKNRASNTPMKFPITIFHQLKLLPFKSRYKYNWGKYKIS
jgi:hypothetical protein